MLRFFAGVGAALLLVAAGFFIWKSHAERQVDVPAAPRPSALLTPLRPAPRPAPPEMTPASKEQKRFARADIDNDGHITRDELLQPRRKPFAKLDANGDGKLSFEEWAVKTTEKFAGADADRSGWLSAAEFETTKPKPVKKKCAC